MQARSIFLPLLLIAACGGSGDDTSTRTAALRGVVYEVDGQTVDRSGVNVTLLQTGRTLTTGPTGTFEFAGIPAGEISLQFGSSIVPAAHGDGDDRERRRGDDDDLEDGEDDSGRWHVRGVSGGDDVKVRVAIRDGKVVEFSCSARNRLRAEARLRRADGSPDADVEGKVKVESRADREKFAIEAEHLAAGSIVEFFLDDPSTPEGFVSIGTATAAGLEGEAELELNTNDGAVLPLGAAAVSELEGFAIEVRLVAGGALLLTGEVPGLPAGGGDPGMPPRPGDDARGRARLTPALPGLEGHVELRTRPEQNRERFKVEAEGLAPGTRVAFLIRDPSSSDTFAQIAVRAAGLDGEAEFQTEGLLPLGVANVGALVGLDVRVVLADGSGTLLLFGTVPELVAD
jgi:hypothetical protein